MVSSGPRCVKAPLRDSLGLRHYKHAVCQHSDEPRLPKTREKKVHKTFIIQRALPKTNITFTERPTPSGANGLCVENCTNSMFQCAMAHCAHFRKTMKRSFLSRHCRRLRWNYDARQARDAITAAITWRNATDKLIAICIIIIVTTASGIPLYLTHNSISGVSVRDLVQCLQFIGRLSVMRTHCQ